MVHAIQLRNQSHARCWHRDTAADMIARRDQPTDRQDIMIDRRGSAVLTVLGFLTFAPPAVADNYPRQPGVDVVHYVFRLSLSDDNNEIIGESTAEIRFVRNDVSEVSLDLASASNGKGMTVAEVTAAGKAVP